MGKKTFIILAVIFCFILLLNLMKPLSSDDYFNAFVWSEGNGLNSFLAENVKRISELDDIIRSLKAYYFSWGGRLVGQGLMTFFVWQGKEIFNIFNTFVFILLIMEIYWLSHEAHIGIGFNNSYIVWIFFSLWAFNICFNDSFLWLAGACDYLWTLVLLLAFLVPYVKKYFDNRLLTGPQKKLAAGIFFLGVLAGNSRETVIGWIIIILSWWLFKCYKQNNLQVWEVTGLIGLCIGYALLILAPGNFSRLTLQQNTDSVFLSSELVIPKLMELLAIISFHLFPWYFLIKFFFYCHKNYDNLVNNKDIDLHFNLIKACVFIVFGSGILMFMIPSTGFRIAFVNLVFLTIAVAVVFRIEEKYGLSLVQDKAKRFLMKVGYLYLALTIAVSLYGNFINWRQWNSILSSVKNAQQNYPDTVLEVEPYKIDEENRLWLLSGFHIIGMPFWGKSEMDPINRSFAKYYGIKGIKIVSVNKER